jgi:hypothetical protein
MCVVKSWQYILNPRPSRFPSGNNQLHVQQDARAQAVSKQVREMLTGITASSPQHKGSAPWLSTISGSSLQCHTHWDSSCSCCLDSCLNLGQQLLLATQEAARAGKGAATGVPQMALSLATTELSFPAALTCHLHLWQSA